MVEAHRVRIPLEGRWVASGARVIQAKLELLVQTSKADFASLDFIVDPGCGITSIPRTMAEERGILIPTEDKIKTIGVRSSIGSQEQRVRLGKIGVRVPGLASRFFYWACHFVEPPHAPYMALLGLEGVLKDLRLVFDGTYSIENPCGVLVLEMTSA
jgi:hypothetical protein